MIMKNVWGLCLCWLMAVPVYGLDVEHELARCREQVAWALRTLAPVNCQMTPRCIGTDDRNWTTSSVKTPEEWCAGFFPGILWMAGEHEAAARYTDELEYLAYSPVYDHDLGFIMIGSYLKGYEATRNPKYREVLMAAADSLATLFNPRVGTLLSWPRNVGTLGGHNTIIDNMMNLELLFFTGKREYREMAVKHAETTMRNQFREDGSVCHVAVYDAATGTHLHNCNHQGFGDESMWARGQAWAVYGYTMVYRYTKEQRFLDFAQKVADKMIERLPKDGVPWWDFDDPAIPKACRDASAGAILADALVELAEYVGQEQGRGYLDVAKRILTTLCSKAYFAGDRKPALLLHSVGNMPAGTEIDCSIIYADYYLLEALLRLDRYKMAGPYEIIARDGRYRHTKGGSERDMAAAHRLAKVGRTAEALEIVDAYSGMLKGMEGHDAPLCAIQCYDLVRAMTLMGELRMPEWEEMVRRVMLPMMEKFEADSPYANGNWGAIVNRLRMACGIFLGDSALYSASIDYFLHANDNGALPNYIAETGQCQETGRDQAHAQLGLEAMAQQCEMAWEQGDDLYGALDNRVLKGFEYTARYNLGEEVPFETWKDCTGLYSDWTEPGAMSRGKLWDIYQLPYDHYVGRKGLEMPYTKRAIEVLAGKRKNKAKETPRMHRVFTYKAPERAPMKKDYEVWVMPRNTEVWTRIDTYMAKVNAPTAEGGHRVSEISYGVFDFTGDVFVKVVCKHRKFRTAKVRPDYKGVITNVLNDSTVQFLLFQPENVSVEFDGDITDNLLLFTAKPAVDRTTAEKEAKRMGRNFVYVAPGFYKYEQPWKIPSHTTVYLAQGAYIEGTLAIEDATEVSVIGRGICRPTDGYEGVHVYRSSKVLIDGVTLCTCPVGGSEGVTLHNVRSISHPGWGDGLNVFASSNVWFDRVFCRNSDDCTTAYATRKGFTGSVRNVSMTNSTLWADVAHPIFIGIHGNAEGADSIVGLCYENIDIMGQYEPQLDYQGCLAINCGDNNVVKDVVFDNIRIENIAKGAILQVKVGYNAKYCKAPGKAVENILFRNIRYNGYGGQEGLEGHEPPMSLILGYDAERTVKNIRFEGLKINGRTIFDGMKGKPGWYKTADMGNIFVNDHVRGLRFDK